MFAQKTAYELRSSDWSSDVCSSDLLGMIEYSHSFGGGNLMMFYRVPRIGREVAGIPDAAHPCHIRDFNSAKPAGMLDRAYIRSRKFGCAVSSMMSRRSGLGRQPSSRRDRGKRARRQMLRQMRA